MEQCGQEEPDQFAIPSRGQKKQNGNDLQHFGLSMGYLMTLVSVSPDSTLRWEIVAESGSQLARAVEGS